MAYDKLDIVREWNCVKIPLRRNCYTRCKEDWEAYVSSDATKRLKGKRLKNPTKRNRIENSVRQIERYCMHQLRNEKFSTAWLDQYTALEVQLDKKLGGWQTKAWTNLANTMTPRGAIGRSHPAPATTKANESGPRPIREGWLGPTRDCLKLMARLLGR